MKTTGILNKYFNGEGEPNRKPLGEFAKELKELSREEKLELAEMAAAEMGVKHEVTTQ